MPIRCALFVDFDNVLLSLQSSSRVAARRFASGPDAWIKWFERGGHDSSEAPDTRRILLRRNYLNPDRFGTYRKFFTYAGFQTVDCPSLTGMGKNSADIHMVLDIIEALDHATRFDEFIILSADADFTPVLLKLREHDRLTGVLSTALTSRALRSAATNAFDLDDFIEDALGVGEEPEEITAGAPLNLPGQEPRAGKMTGSILEVARVAARLAERLKQEGAVPLDQVPRLLLSDYPAFRDSNWLGFQTLHAMVDGLIKEGVGLARTSRPDGLHLTVSTPSAPTTSQSDEAPASAEEVLDFLEAALSKSEAPLRGASAGLQVIQSFGPSIKQEKWFGSGSLLKLIVKAERPNLAAANISGGLIYDPRRHNLEAIPESMPIPLSEDLPNTPDDPELFSARLNSVGWPPLSPSQIAQVIAQAARLIAEGVIERTPLSSQIRDAISAAASRGEILDTDKVSRARINVLLTGAISSGATFGVNCCSEGEIRNHLRTSLMALIENRLGPPSQSDSELVDRLLGRHPSGVDGLSSVPLFDVGTELAFARDDLAEDGPLLVDAPLDS